jgi:hypothetical protein
VNLIMLYFRERAIPKNFVNPVFTNCDLPINGMWPYIRIYVAIVMYVQ